MKRKDLNLGAVVISFMLMTSCMGDGGDTVKYHRVGIVHENPMRCIHTTDDKGNIYVVSSPEFETREELKDGYCCQVDFKTDFKDELGDGVYKAEIFKYDSVAVWPMHNVLTDTSAVLESERIVSLDFNRSVYLDGHLFLQARHPIHQADQKDIFNLSYDPNQDVLVMEDGTRVYDLFLRAAQEGGSGDSISWISTTAFVIEDFLRDVKVKESAAGVDNVNFRINFPTGFNADTTGCIWSVTDIFTLRFKN